MDYSSINPLTMFYAAGLVGKSVILLLLAASVYTWVLIVMGAYSIVKISRSAQTARSGGDVGVLAPIDAVGKAAPPRSMWRASRPMNAGSASPSR